MLKATIKLTLNVFIFLVVSLAFLPVQGGNTPPKRKIPKDEPEVSLSRSAPMAVVVKQSRAVITPKDEKLPSYFRDLPQGVPQIIFSFLGADDNKSAQLVCKNWKQVSDDANFHLERWFLLESTWNVTPEEFVHRALYRPTHVLLLLDKLDPLALEGPYAMPAQNPIVNASTELQKRLKVVFRGTAFNYQHFVNLVGNPQNHITIHRHLRAGALLRECKDQEATQDLSIFTKMLSSVLPQDEEIGEVQGFRQRGWKLKRKFEWLSAQPFWAMYCSDHSVWRQNMNFLPHYNIVGWKGLLSKDDVKHIFDAYQFFFSNTKTSEYDELMSLFSLVFSLNGGNDDHIQCLEQRSKNYFIYVLELIKAYVPLKREEEALELCQLLLEKVKDVSIYKGNRETLRLIILKRYLKTILQSKNPLQYKERVDGFIGELMAAIKSKKKMRVQLLHAIEDNQFYEEIESKITRGQVIAFKNYFDLLLRRIPLESLEDSAFDSSEFLNVIEIYGIDKLEAYEKRRIQVVLRKTLLEGYKKISSLSEEMRKYGLKCVNISRYYNTLKNIFFDEPSTLQLIESLTLLETSK
jgi:hypothetical protein